MTNKQDNEHRMRRFRANIKEVQSSLIVLGATRPYVRMALTQELSSLRMELKTLEDLAKTMGWK